MCVDIPNAFIQADLPKGPIDERIVMKTTGVLVDILVDVPPNIYSGYVVYKKKKRVLYVEVLKALDNKFCYCCGSKDHLSFDCSKKAKVPRDQWYVNKMHSHVQQLMTTGDQQCNEHAGPSSTNRHNNNQSTASAMSATQTLYKFPPPRTGDVNCQIERDETEFLHH